MVESLATLFDLLTRREFVVGVTAGLVAAGLLFALPKAERERVADWGLLLVTAALIAIHLTVARRLGLVVGITTLAAGGWASRREGPALRLVGWAAIVAGAAIVALRGGLPDVIWFQVLTPIVIIATGTAMAAWSRSLPHHLVGVLMAISAFGVWATVPETEMARALLGTSLPMALVTLRPTEARVFVPGAYAVAGLVGWLAASGGAARPASIIGGWACLGLLVILPYCRPSAARLVEQRPWLIVAIHAVVVLIASRVIGLWESTLPAMVAAAFLAMLAYLLLGRLLQGRESAT